MFDMVYSGHCNKQGCKEVRLAGLHLKTRCGAALGLLSGSMWPTWQVRFRSGSEDIWHQQELNICM